jgi:hypothetical protein
MGDHRQKAQISGENRFQKIKLWCFKCILIICFFFPSIKAVAPGFEVITIYTSEPVDAYNRLIIATIQVESSGDTLAFNLAEEAVGAFQIRPIRILDYNRRTGNNYKLEDCYSLKISKEIFLYYAIENDYLDYESIARNWNGSGRTTLDYWKKIKKYL